MYYDNVRVVCSLFGSLLVFVALHLKGDVLSKEAQRLTMRFPPVCVVSADFRSCFFVERLSTLYTPPTMAPRWRHDALARLRFKICTERTLLTSAFCTQNLCKVSLAALCRRFAPSAGRFHTHTRPIHVVIRASFPAPRLKKRTFAQRLRLASISSYQRSGPKN